MRDAVRHVASLFPTAIISGRSRDKVGCSCSSLKLLFIPVSAFASFVESFFLLLMFFSACRSLTL
jgi:hypothetical protein